ncbi:MAG: thiopurine S-methyltransferase [Segniliparus sp.]|uniref:thiopurine S-methyltransferase n=1 Tax=Segniliparus sp. TaxID=2804064 RepID=UPI003F3EB778
MFFVFRPASLVCCAAVVALLAGCAPAGRGHGAHGPSHAAPSAVGQAFPARTLGGASASPQDREQLGDFCGWYADDLPESMDTVSEFLGAFGVAGGDYSDSRIAVPAEEAAQSAGDAVDALNGFLAAFPGGLSDPARRAVLGLRDAMTALASAIRDKQGADQINAQVALFDEAYKALRPACA